MAGKLTCKKMTRTQAVNKIASEHNMSIKAAGSRLSSALDNYEDSIDFGDSASGSDRYLYTKRGMSDLKMCVDSRRPSNTKRSASKLSLNSKPVWGLGGAVAGFILGKVLG